METKIIYSVLKIKDLVVLKKKNSKERKQILNIIKDLRDKKQEYLTKKQQPSAWNKHELDPRHHRQQHSQVPPICATASGPPRRSSLASLSHAPCQHMR